MLPRVTPYILILAVVFGVASYGLHRRTVWAWWGGWLVFFLGAGFYGTYTYSALYYAESLTATLSAVVYIVGGAVLWVPAAVWWSGRRGYFGRRSSASPGREPHQRTDGHQGER